MIATLSIVTCVGCGHPAHPAPVQPVQAVAAPDPVAAAAPAPAEATAAEGKQLFEARGCVSCHAVDGTQRVGPPLNGYLGRELTLADGTRVIGSEVRFLASLDSPEPLKDYRAVMPTYGDMVDEHARQAMIAYVKSLP